MFYEVRNVGGAEYFRKDTENNMNFPRHIHHSFEIILVTDGEIKASVNSETYTLKEGDALLIFPHQVHSISSEASSHVTYIFSPLLVNSFYSALRDKVPVSGAFRIPDALVTALSSLSPDSTVVEKKGVLYSVCAEFDRGAEYVERQYKNGPFYELFSFVEENYTGECMLSDAVERVGMNYSYISRNFKKLVGMSFNDYVNLMRLNQACYLLKNTDRSITDCGFESGFRSIHTFNRNFKERYGISPQQYRKEQKN